MVNFPGVRKIARVTRYREVLKDGKEPGNETVYLITSLDSATASAADLLPLNRAHWLVENNNHRQRDCNFGEDACLTHTGNGPLNRACLNTIALAVIFATRGLILLTPPHFSKTVQEPAAVSGSRRSASHTAEKRQIMR